MEERYKLAIIKLPENAYYLWVKYISESYRKEHVIPRQIDDNPEDLLSITLYHTHPGGILTANQKKLQKLEEIITDLFLHSSHDLLDCFEDIAVPLEYKMELMKKLRKKGAELLYYRFVLRTLINYHRLAREALRLDRDEELEAVHHLNREKNSNPQINFEIGVWKSIEEKHTDADFHFTEIYKTLPSNYTPRGDPEKICTLTIDKLKGYLGIFPEKMETEQDESYAREIFHYSKELDGKRRVTRDLVDEQEGIDLEMLNQNLDLIRSRIEQDGLGDQFLRAKVFLKAAVSENKGYSALSRKLFEEILSRITENDLHFWTDSLYGCVILTALEGNPNEKYYETTKEIMENFGFPNLKEWAQIVGLNFRHHGFPKFLNICKTMQLPDDIINLSVFVSNVIKLSQAEEPISSDKLSGDYLDFLDSIEKVDIKYLQKLINYFQDPLICKNISRWLFTAVRVLKFIHKERKTDADDFYSVFFTQYFELISFEPEFMIDIPTDIDYKIKTGVHDYSKLMRLTKTAIGRTKMLLPGAYNDYFLGNVFILEEKFNLAAKEYLRASRTIDSVKFYRRLIYSIMKIGAMFEGILLYQLADPDYSIEKVKKIKGSFTLQKFLFKFIIDVDMLEYIIEKNQSRRDIVTILLQLVESPERHQSGNMARVKKIYLDKMLDLLHFSTQNAKKGKDNNN